MNQKREPQNQTEREWVDFARAYVQARGQMSCFEPQDFVVQCLRYLDYGGGMTQKQWDRAILDYRFVLWNKDRSMIERRAKQAAEEAAARVRANWIRARPRRYRVFSEEEESSCDTHEDWGKM